MNGRRRGTIGCAAPQGTTSTLDSGGGLDASGIPKPGTLADAGIPEVADRLASALGAKATGTF
ncbi:MAG: hypothetical protein FJ087_16735 [Deltaproteobacteria bacterium]|nr:hypothetical protein [Deltaproteobacteria bacterium]